MTWHGQEDDVEAGHLIRYCRTSREPPVGQGTCDPQTETATMPRVAFFFISFQPRCGGCGCRRVFGFWALESSSNRDCHTLDRARSSISEATFCEIFDGATKLAGR